MRDNETMLQPPESAECGSGIVPAYYGSLGTTRESAERRAPAVPDLNEFVYRLRQFKNLYLSEDFRGLSLLSPDIPRESLSYRGDSLFYMLKAFRLDMAVSNGLYWFGIEPGEERAHYDVGVGGKDPKDHRGFPVYLGSGDSRKADNFFMYGAVPLDGLDREIDMGSHAVTCGWNSRDPNRFGVFVDYAKRVANNTLLRRDSGHAEMDFFVLNEDRICSFVAGAINPYVRGAGSFDMNVLNSVMGGLSTNPIMNQLFDSMRFDFHPYLQPFIEEEKRREGGQQALMWDVVKNVPHEKMYAAVQNVALMAVARLIFSGRLDRRVLDGNVKNLLARGLYLGAGAFIEARTDVDGCGGDVNTIGGMVGEFEVEGREMAAFVVYTLMYDDNLPSCEALNIGWDSGGCRVVYYEDLLAYVTKAGVRDDVVEKVLMEHHIAFDVANIKVVRREKTWYRDVIDTTKVRDRVNRVGRGSAISEGTLATQALRDRLRDSGVPFGGEADYELSLADSVPYVGDCGLRFGGGVTGADLTSVGVGLSIYLSDEFNNNEFATRLARFLLVLRFDSSLDPTSTGSFIGAHYVDRKARIPVARIKEVLSRYLDARRNEGASRGEIDMLSEALSELGSIRDN